MLSKLMSFFLKVTEDDQEIGAYMFRRTVHSLHITPDDVRWMVSILLSFDFFPINAQYT